MDNLTVSRRRVLQAALGASAITAGLALKPAEAYIPMDEVPCEERPAHCGDWEALARKIDTEILPIPDGNPVPLSSLGPPGGSGFTAFREPYPRVPVWNPPGTRRVGIQAGHWKYNESPDELANNRQNPGTSGGGKAEWQVNLDIAERVVGLLQNQGILVDLLHGTTPIRYRAHAFVSIHADGDVSGQLRGYKIGSAIFSATPEVDQLLVDALWEEYGAVTGLTPQPNQVSRRMTGYYAFNSKRYQHAIAPGVPHAIVETAFLTNAQDRDFLFRQPDRVARGIVNGISRFLTANT